MIIEISTYRLVKDLILLENKLNEGLIMTHDIHDSKKIIENFISAYFWYNIEIDINKFKILLSDGKFNTNSYLEFLILINNLGYFISNIKAKNKNNITNTINPNDFKNNYLNDKFLQNIIEYNFVIEPKFDTAHKLKTNILYHVTETRYLYNILKNGLVAKSKNTLSEYPERIYFVYNIEDANTYIKSKKFYYLMNQKNAKQPIKSNFKEIKYVILKIELPENNNLILYEDPNFVGKGIYTYENISPKFINIENK